MDRNQIICIFCCFKADIVRQDMLKVVRCKHCKRETELDTYQDMFEQWIDDIRKEG